MTPRPLLTTLRPVVLFAMLVCTVHLAARLWMVPQYRTELGGVERNVVAGVQKLMRGMPLYSDPEALPFDVMQYTPAYYLLCAGLADLAGVDPHAHHGVFVTSRVLSLLLNMLTVLLLGHAARLAGAGRWQAAMAALLLFCAYTEPAYSRIDALHLFFFAAALPLYLAWWRRDRAHLLALAACCTALAYFSKQSGLLVGGLIGLHLLMERRFRALALFGGVLLVLLAGGQAWAYHTWGRAVYLQNTVGGLMNGVNLVALKDLLLYPVHLLGLGWYVLAGWVALRPQEQPAQRFLRMAAPLALGAGLAMALKSGSSLNYLYEGHALTAVGVAVLLSQPRGTERSWRRFALPYLLFFMLAKTLLVIRWVNVYGPDAAHREALQADEAVYRVLTEEMGLGEGQYVFLGYRDHLEHLLLGQVVMPQKDIVYLSRGELFDRSAFHQAMQDGTVLFAVFDRPTTEVTFLGRSYPGFEPVREVRGRHILEFTGTP